MPWLKFSADFDFHPPERPVCTIAYKRGMVKFVRRVCGDQAIAAGRAELTQRPK